MNSYVSILTLNFDALCVVKQIITRKKLNIAKLYISVNGFVLRIYRMTYLTDSI